MSSSHGWSDSNSNVINVLYDNNEINGAYYTWCAATASKGRYCTGATTTNNESEYSICPRGWELPSIADYESMMRTAKINFKDCKSGTCSGSSSASDSSKIQGEPYSFAVSGWIYDGVLMDVDSNGGHWSSTNSDNTNAYSLFFNSANVSTYGYSRFFGYPIRCIAP